FEALMPQRSIANGAIIFFGHLLADLMVGISYNVITTDIVLHHSGFIVFVVLITYNCFAAYLAGCFLLMEVSTLFLNSYSFFRNRLGYSHWFVKSSFGAFSVTFISFRMVIGLYVGVKFLDAAHQGYLSSGTIVGWQLALICPAIFSTFIMNLVWLYGIGKKTAKIYASGEETVEPANGHDKLVEEDLDSKLVENESESEAEESGEVCR
ncbi:unnamed protein product, partial [Polarella glacialis]